jgi:hypothetical protein
MSDFAVVISGVVVMAIILGGGYLIWLLVGFLHLKRDPQQHELATLLAQEATSEIAYGVETMGGYGSGRSGGRRSRRPAAAIFDRWPPAGTLAASRPREPDCQHSTRLG